MRRQVGSPVRSSSTMKLKTGIVGMPNVGKSTLFNAVTEAQGAMCANYPFATIEPNIGVVEVPDGRLEVLAEINKSVKTVPSTLDFYDIAGLVKVKMRQTHGIGLGSLSSRSLVVCLHTVVYALNAHLHTQGRGKPSRVGQAPDFGTAASEDRVLIGNRATR